LLILFILLILLPASFGWILYIGMLPYAFLDTVYPSVRLVTSRRTAMNEQGEMKGLFTSLMILGEILGPPLFIRIYYSARVATPKETWSYSAPFLLELYLGS
jgi:hypothetical protein